MRVKFIGGYSIRFGARLVNVGDELDLGDAEANEAIRGGMFVLADKPEPKVKTKKKKPVDTVESTDATEEEN